MQKIVFSISLFITSMSVFGATGVKDTMAWVSALQCARINPSCSSQGSDQGCSQRKIIHSIAELDSAIKLAGPGDTLLMAAGQYQLDRVLEIRSRGTAHAPIVIAGETSGKVIFTGKGGISIKAPAAYIVVRDFVFRHRSSQARCGEGTSHCRWSHNVFETTGNGDDLTIAGDAQEIDHNSFLNKNAMGRFLAIRGHDSQIATDLWIHHNYFAHFKDQGGKNGAEAFQFGLSGYSMSSSNSLVEHNLFEDCNGEAELISVKASAVTLRYNTFRDSKAQFTLRHGNHNIVYGNFFFKTPGIRFFGDDHLIYSNYFQNCSLAIQIGNGDGEVADGARLTCHDRPDRNFVGLNTLINNKVGIIFNARKDGLGATKTQIAGNLIFGGGLVAKIEQNGGPFISGTWTDNVYYGTAGAGDLGLGQSSAYKDVRQSGNRIEDPKLSINAERSPDNVHLTQGAIYRLSKQSPPLYLHDHLSAVFDADTVTDMDGQVRKGRWNIGADQLSPRPVINYPLDPPTQGAVGINNI